MTDVATPLPKQPQKLKISPLVILAVALVAILTVNEQTRLLGKLLGFMSLLVLVHLSGLVMGGILSGVPVLRIKLYFGPALLSFGVGRTSVELGLIPLGGFVQLKGMVRDAAQEPAPDDFQALPVAWRMGCILLGPLFLFLVGGICLGFVPACTSFANGFWQFVNGAVKPLASGVGYLAALTNILRSQGAFIALGILACKLAALNLFPIGGTNAGQMLQQISPKVEAFFEKYATAGAVIMLGLLVGWVIAIASFSYRFLVTA